jgi:hypothetical protein
MKKLKFSDQQIAFALQLAELAACRLSSKGGRLSPYVPGVGRRSVDQNIRPVRVLAESNLLKPFAQHHVVITNLSGR